MHYTARSVHFLGLMNSAAKAGHPEAPGVLRFGFRGLGSGSGFKAEARKLEHHYHILMPLRQSIGNPSTNHPESMFQLSAVHYRGFVGGVRVVVYKE